VSFQQTNTEPNALNGHRLANAVEMTESNEPWRRSGASVPGERLRTFIKKLFSQPRWIFVSVVVIGLSAGSIVISVQSGNRTVERSGNQPADAALRGLGSVAQAARQMMIEGTTLAIRNSDRDRTKVEAVRSRSSTAALALYGLCALLGVFGAVFAVQVMRSHAQSSTQDIEQAARMTELEQFAARPVALGPLPPASLGLDVLEASGISANLSHVFEGLKEDFLRFAADAGVHLTIEPVPNVQVACGEAAVTIVLQNLVRNAIKYIGDGPSKRIVARTAISGSTVHLAVQDFGSGIPFDADLRIFEPCVRPTGWCQPATGLGLATVKRIVEAHGGQLGIRPRPGHSACFWVNIPLAN
jgi:signal transduction histidine kinase